MAVNRGKKFEDHFRQCCERVNGLSIDRVHDQTTRFKGSQNICDFIVYKQPYEYYFECKTVHGNTLSICSRPKTDKHGNKYHFYGNITDTQWRGLLEKSKIKGVFAGVICWWVDKDVTLFIPIKTLNIWRTQTAVKSVRYDIYKKDFDIVRVLGDKKRVFFDYNIETLLKEIAHEN